MKKRGGNQNYPSFFCLYINKSNTNHKVEKEKKTMSKKYELVKENTTTMDNATLYQIRSLIAIPEHEVAIGTLGGFIEGEHNLSQESSCWIEEGSVVMGKATIKDDSIIHKGCVIKDKATIKGKSSLEDTLVQSRSVIEDSIIHGMGDIHSEIDLCHITNARIQGSNLFHVTIYGENESRITLSQIREYVSMIGDCIIEESIVMGPINIVGSTLTCGTFIDGPSDIVRATITNSEILLENLAIHSVSIGNAEIIEPGDYMEINLPSVSDEIIACYSKTIRENIDNIETADRFQFVIGDRNFKDSKEFFKELKHDTKLVYFISSCLGLE